MLFSFEAGLSGGANDIDYDSRTMDITSSAGFVLLVKTMRTAMLDNILLQKPLICWFSLLYTYSKTLRCLSWLLQLSLVILQILKSRPGSTHIFALCCNSFVAMYLGRDVLAGCLNFACLLQLRWLGY